MTFKSGMNRLDNSTLKRRQAFSSPRREATPFMAWRGDCSRVQIPSIAYHRIRSINTVLTLVFWGLMLRWILWYQ